ncbi:MAG: BatD family protein [Shinella sp.]|uniref:BatD family protein n=1 Tax=Shinella sp. TaxID=1870904 RepID=UPI0040360C92
MTLLRFAVALWLVLGSAGFAAEPFARVKIEDTGRIVPGQQVRVDVEVFVPDFFTSPPQFPLFDLPNALVTLPDGRALNMVETIDGVQYAGIRRTYAVVPTAPGTFTLPPAVITLGYSQNGKPVPGQTTLPETRFTVAEPSGGTATALTFAARGLTITQSFDRDPSTLKVGDALVRTITVFAKDTQAMLIPAVPVVTVAGMKQYPKSASIADGVQAEDRTTGSTRTETTTFVAEIAGAIEIPAVSYPWFDIDAQAKAIAALPGTPVKVSKATPARTGLAPQLEQTDPGSDRTWPSKATLAAAAALLVVLAAICWLFVKTLPWMKRRLRAFADGAWVSERRSFKRLMAAIRVSDPMTVYRHLEDWTRSAGYGSIGDWVNASGNGDVVREAEKLQRELFGPDRDRPGFNRAALSKSVRAARKHSENREGIARPSALPKLNPDSAAIG